MFTLINLIIAVLGISILIAGIVPLLKSEVPALEKVVKNKDLIKRAAIFFITLQLLIGMFQMRKLISIGMDDFEMFFYLLAMLSVLVMTFVTGKEVFSKLNSSAKN
jgi:uncharacterized membrane protein